MVSADARGNLLPTTTLPGPAPAPRLTHPNACELHLWTGENGQCPECRSVVEVERRPTDRTPLPPTLYTDDYRAGYNAGHADSLAGLAPRPGESPMLLAPGGRVAGEEFRAGYDAALCAHRLGADVQKMIDDDTLEPSLESVPTIVDRLLALRPELVAVPTPRRLLAERLLERFMSLPTELDRPADRDLALECFERAVNWYFQAHLPRLAGPGSGFASQVAAAVPFRVVSEADMRFTPPDLLEAVDRVFGTSVIPVMAFLNLTRDLARSLGVEHSAKAIEQHVSELAAVVHVEGEGHGT